MDKLEEMVHLAIKSASLCWGEIPTSNYDEGRAGKIADTLIHDLRAYFDVADLTEILAQVNERIDVLLKEADHASISEK